LDSVTIRRLLFEIFIHYSRSNFNEEHLVSLVGDKYFELKK